VTGRFVVSCLTRQDSHTLIRFDTCNYGFIHDIAHLGISFQHIPSSQYPNIVFFSQDMLVTFVIPMPMQHVEPMREEERSLVLIFAPR
jgi:hypothetical protein